MSSASVRSFVRCGGRRASLSSEVTHESDRCAVEALGTFAAEALCAEGWPRASAARSARRPQRDSLGHAHSRTVARLAATLSALPDLSSTLSTVGEVGRCIAC
jgi:hypothetical protein